MRHFQHFKTHCVYKDVTMSAISDCLSQCQSISVSFFQSQPTTSVCLIQFQSVYSCMSTSISLIPPQTASVGLDSENVLLQTFAQPFLDMSCRSTTFVLHRSYPFTWVIPTPISVYSFMPLSVYVKICNL